MKSEGKALVLPSSQILAIKRHNINQSRESSVEHKPLAINTNLVASDVTSPATVKHNCQPVQISLQLDPPPSSHRRKELTARSEFNTSTEYNAKVQTQQYKLMSNETTLKKSVPAISTRQNVNNYSVDQQPQFNHYVTATTDANQLAHQRSSSLGGNQTMNSVNNDHYITKGSQQIVHHHKRTNSSDTNNGKLYKSSDEMMMMYEQQKKQRHPFINWNGVMNDRPGESSQPRNSIVIVPNQ